MTQGVRSQVCLSDSLCRFCFPNLGGSFFSPEGFSGILPPAVSLGGFSVTPPWYSAMLEQPGVTPGEGRAQAFQYGENRTPCKEDAHLFASGNTWERDADGWQPFGIIFSPQRLFIK